MSARSILATLVLVASGCGTSVDSTTSQDSATAVAPAPPVAADDLAADPFAITAGSGVEGCQVGDPKQNAIEVFGEPFTDDGGYVSFPKAGVEIACDASGRIVTLFLFYQAPDFTAYRGTTVDGIGPQSTADEVVGVYGEPARVGESVISEFGAKPGAHEKSLEYPDKGIVFTFWDGSLADIRISEPEKG